MLFALWLACTPPTHDAPRATGSGDTADAGLHTTASPFVPTVQQLHWRGGPATVTATDGTHTRTWADAAAPLALLGLAAGASYDVTVTLPDGEHHLVVQPPPAPEGLDELVVTGGGEVGSGHVLVHAYDRPRGLSYAALFDGAGRVLWWREDPAGDKVVRARLDAAGTGVWWAVTGWQLEPGHSRVVHTALDGSTEASWDAPGLHHDLVERDGAIHYLAHEVDPDVHIGLVPSLPTASDVVRRLDLATGATDDGFGFFEGYPHAPWSPCDHAVLPGFLPGAVEWTHTNSLLPWGDGWLLLPRYLDALVAVGDDGFRWQAGGRHTTLTADDASSVVLHGHATHALDDQRLLVFDNHSHVEGAASRVVELRLLPEEGRYEAVWSLEEPRGRYVDFLGDARRLPGGTTLVAWSPYGELEAFDPDGTSTWHLTSQMVVGRVEFLPTLPGG